LLFLAESLSALIIELRVEAVRNNPYF
jgi:hypothetical protein